MFCNLSLVLISLSLPSFAKEAVPEPSPESQIQMIQKPVLQRIQPDDHCEINRAPAVLDLPTDRPTEFEPDPKYRFLEDWEPATPVRSQKESVSSSKDQR